MADYTLTLYQDDDVTPLFEVGTAAAHAHPYLVMPEAFGEAEVDLQQGKALIGQINVRVIDPQTGATQADRYLTGLLANASGYSALNGRRAVLAQVSPAVVVQDGVCFGVTLADDFASFDLQLRDIRERGRKVQVFARSGTTTVFPRGVLDGYGRLPASYFGEDRWLVAPTDYLTGTYRVTPAQFGRQIGSIYFPTLPQIVPTKYVFTDRMRAASGWSTRIIDGESKAIHADIEILWRPVGGSTWTHLRDIETIPIDGITPFATQVAQIRDASGQLVTANVVAGILVGFVDDGQTRPTDGQRVEWLVLYVGPPSDDYPLHFEGTWGTFTRNLLRGDYCGVDESGNTIDPRLRYDESAVLAIDTPVRIRITEPQDDLRTVLEELCAGIGAAPALNDVGKISPIVYHLPDASETLPEINDSNAQPISGWDHPTDNAVTVVEAVYERDYRVPLDDDPKSERSAGDGLASREITIRRAPDDLVGALGEHELKLDLWMFRAAGTVEGQPVSGELVDEMAAQVAVERQHQAIDRFAYGGVSSAAQISASEFSALRAGDWVLDARSWRPNYATGKRGGNTLAQVVSIRKLNPAWWEVHLVDAGPEDQPIDQPTLGTVTAAADGVVSVPVATVPVGGEARVDYALSSTVPATDSPLWTFLGRTASAATVKSPAQPAGATVWVRSRGEGIARRPSAWTNAVSVVIPGTARVLSAAVTIDALGRATASWNVNEASLGLRLTFAAHSEDADPPDPLTGTQDVDASAGAAVLTGLTVRPGETLTVDFEPWTGWSGSAVSGTAGDTVRRQAGVEADESSYSLDLREVGRAPDDSTATFDGPWGSKIVEVRTFEALVAQPYATDSWPSISGDPTQGPFTARVPIVFAVPPQGYARLVYVVGILADGTPGAIERLTILPTGTEPDLVTGLTVLVNDADGSATIRVDVADRTGSIRYAYAVGADPAWSSDAAVEASTVLAITGSATITLPAGTVDYLETLRFRCCAYTGADGTGYDGAGDHGPIVGGEDIRLPSDVTLTQTTASEAGGVGTFGATLHDASGICTAIEKFTRSGAGDWVGPILITGTPTNGTEYTATVSLQEDHQSQIKIRATYTKNGSVGYVECPSPGFDAGQIPNIAVVPDIDEVARTASAAVSGDFDTASIKIVASTSATPAAATVRAATAINGRDLTPADIGALVTGLTAGDTVYFAAFGYSEEDGGGNESTSLAVAQKTVGVVAPLLEVSSESETSSTGTFAVTLRDPSGVATAIYYRTKSGSGAWSARTLVTGTPANGTEYQQTVTLEEDHLSFIRFELDFTVLGVMKTFVLASSGFDKGKIPSGSIKIDLDMVGATASASADGDFDTASWKIAASKTAIPSDATVRAATAINGRSLTRAAVGTLLSGLVAGDTVHLAAFGYSGAGGAGNESSVKLTDSRKFGVSTPAYSAGSVTAGILSESSRRFGSSVVFSATDNNTVAWAAGTITLSDGTAYSIAAGNTGNMAGETYIYLDPAVSTTVLQTATTPAGATGDRKIAVCYAWPIASASEFAGYVPAVGKVGLNSENVQYNAINANHITSIFLSVIQAVVATLSAIVADLGTIIAGIIQNAASNPTAAIRISSSQTMPPTATRYIDMGDPAGIRMSAVLSSDTGGDDGAGTKVLPKGAITGTVYNGQSVVFSDTYNSPPAVIFFGGATDEGRSKWGSLAQADTANGVGAGTGTGTTARPGSALIAQAPTADVSTTGFTAHLRLVGKTSPTATSASFASPTVTSVGTATGVATPLTAQVPSSTGTYLASFEVGANNGTGLTDATVSIEVVAEVAMGAGAYAEYASKWVTFVVAAGVTDSALSSITIPIDGIAGGDDNFRLVAKTFTSTGGHPTFDHLTASSLSWSYDATTSYASMTPGGAADSVQFLVLATG